MLIARAIIVLIMLAAAGISANAQTINGRASVIDGDTIEIHRERIRILDIDAPESRQMCTNDGGVKWRCGQQASLALADWIGQQTVTCVTDKLDKYRRHLAHCVVAGQDLGQWMAAQGWAVPYRQCKCEVIQDATKAAKQAKAGIWSGTFIMPWDWRAQQAGQSSAEQPTGQPTVIKHGTSQDACLIKGNISSKGERIYHVPGGKWYDATKISESKGERWFCSEAEARAAGWRPSKQ